MWCHWQGKKFTLPNARGVLSLLSSSPVASDTHESIEWGQNICTDCVEAGCLAAVQTNKQTELFRCVRPPEQRGLTKLSQLLQPVFRLFSPAQNLAVTQLQSHLAVASKVLKD